MIQFIIDITRVFRYRKKQKLMTGIDRVTIAYIRHYGEQAHALVRWCGRAWLLPKRESHLLFSWIMNSKTKISTTPILWRGIIKPVKLNPNQPTFLLNTGHISTKHDDYAKLIKAFSVKPIFFVHDLIPIEYPEYCFPGEDKRHEEKMAFVSRYAQGIITNSQATNAALQAYHSRIASESHHKHLPPSTVAWLGSSFKSAQKTQRPFEKTYFVLNSTIEPRKNHLLILHLWRKLYQQYGEETPYLFVIGKRGWECEQVVDLLERSKILQKRVKELNQCPDHELAAYLQHAQAVLLPSFAEGFGLGLVEALTYHTPVIASDLPVFKEIAGEIPDYAAPLDGAQWETLVLDYAKVNSPLRRAQLERLLNYSPPTWEKHFERVDAFLNTAVTMSSHEKQAKRVN